jgi:hypothetical protein
LEFVHVKQCFRCNHDLKKLSAQPLTFSFERPRAILGCLELSSSFRKSTDLFPTLALDYVKGGVK